MSKTNVVNVIINLALLLLNNFFILTASSDFLNFKLILIIEFSSYFIFNLSKYLFLLKKFNKESLITFIISFIALLTTIFFNKERTLILIFLIWFALMCFLKLKKSDYFHDRKNPKWITNIIILIIFLIMGITTGFLLTLNYNDIIITSYFFIIASLLETISSLEYGEK